MSVLIKRAIIIDPASPYHKKKADIYLNSGRIEKIGRGLKVKARKTYAADNLHVSPGWCDIGTQIGEPGLEHREDLRSVANAAAAGGYTTLASFPNTDPVVDSKPAVEYIRNRSASLPIHIYPIGAISRRAEGREIAEMQDMHDAGAIAFSDGRNSLTHGGVMKLALQYVRSFGGLIINKALDLEFAVEGQMHESAVSTSLGLKGIPVMAEKLMVQRDLELLDYTQSRLHIFGVASSEAVKLLKTARKTALSVSASTPALNLLLTDKDLDTFDTNLKVLPPLRSNNDRKALIQAIDKGVITCITSNHDPLEEELKKVEFAHADFGASNLETAFSVANTSLHGQIDTETIVHCFCQGPRSALGLDTPVINVDETAELTLFDPGKSWTVARSDIHSKSRNNAMVGHQLTGRVLGVFSKNQFILNNQA